METGTGTSIVLPATDPLSSYPSFSSRFITTARHPKREEIIPRIQSYFLNRWPWPSDSAKDEYLEYDVDQWGLLVTPTASPERAELISAYCVFFFLYDDVLEEMNAVEVRKSVERITGIISRELTPDAENPIEATIHDLCCRMESIGTKKSHTIAQQVFSYTCHYIRTAGDKQKRAASLEAGFDGYVKYRIDEGGYWFTIAAAMWAQDLLVPPHIWFDPAMQPLHRIAGSHEMLVNDMFSYRWERKLHQAMHANPDGSQTPAPEDYYVLYNGVTALLHEDEGQGQITPANVMDRLQSHISAIEDEFPVARSNLIEQYSSRPESEEKNADIEVIKRAMEVLEAFMAGNATWSTICGRYNGDWHKF